MVRPADRLEALIKMTVIENDCIVGFNKCRIPFSVPVSPAIVKWNAKFKLQLVPVIYTVSSIGRIVQAVSKAFDALRKMRSGESPGSYPQRKRIREEMSNLFHSKKPKTMTGRAWRHTFFVWVESTSKNTLVKPKKKIFLELALVKKRSVLTMQRFPKKSSME